VLLVIGWHIFIDFTRAGMRYYKIKIENGYSYTPIDGDFIRNIIGFALPILAIILSLISLIS